MVSCVSTVCFSTHPPTAEIYTLSLHDALPIFLRPIEEEQLHARRGAREDAEVDAGGRDGGAKRRASPFDQLQHLLDRKSTRLNSSHLVISYAVFCLKKKKKYQPYNTKHTHNQD